MFPFLMGFGGLTGRTQDKAVDMFNEEIAHWSIDVLKGSARGIKHTAMTTGSCIALGLRAGDKNGRCSFDKRFFPQIVSKGWGYISSKGENSPIVKLTEIVILDAKKNRSSSYLKGLAKFAFANRLKAVTVNIVITQISSYLVDVTIARYIVNQAFQGFAKSVATLGLGFTISLGDVAEQSYQAVLRLKTKNNKVYTELYNRNLECFWYLVEDNLKEFVY